MLGDIRLGRIIGLPWKGRALRRKKYPLAFPLSESQLEILDELERYGPINPNKLCKKAGKAYSFVFNTLKNFELRGMVTLRREKNEKGTYSKIYELALEGVLFILQRQLGPIHPDYGFINNLINKYESLLPLIFGKWNHFRKMKVETIAFLRLKVLVDSYVKEPLSFKRGTGFIPGMERIELINWFFYFQFHHFKYGEAWITTIKQDEELKEYTINELKAYQKRLEQTNNIIEETVILLETP